MRFAIALIAIVLGPFAAGAQETGPVLGIGISDEHGPYVTANGQPVYAFLTQDVRGGDGLPALQSCKQRCITDWPLLTTTRREVTVADLLDPDLATWVNWEGKRVVQYNSYPLFFYAAEDPGGEPDGHAIHTYGGWWVLVAPDGEPISSGIVPEPPASDDG